MIMMEVVIMVMVMVMTMMVVMSVCGGQTTLGRGQKWEQES